MLWCRSYPTLPDRIAGNNRVVAKSFRTLPIIPDSGRSYGAQTQLESFAESPTNGKIIHGEVQGLSATVLGVSIQQHWYYLFGNWLYDCWWVHYYHFWSQSGGARPRIGRAWVRYRRDLEFFTPSFENPRYEYTVLEKWSLRCYYSTTLGG